jgi:hypothetical protein
MCFTVKFHLFCKLGPPEPILPAKQETIWQILTLKSVNLQFLTVEYRNLCKSPCCGQHFCQCYCIQAIITGCAVIVRPLTDSRVAQAAIERFSRIAFAHFEQQLICAELPTRRFKSVK